MGWRPCLCLAFAGAKIQFDSGYFCNNGGDRLILLRTCLYCVLKSECLEDEGEDRSVLAVRASATREGGSRLGAQGQQRKGQGAVPSHQLLRLLTNDTVKVSSWPHHIVVSIHTRMELP